MVMDVVVALEDQSARKEMTKSTTPLLRNAFNGSAHVVHYSFAISRQVTILRFFVISTSSICITFPGGKLIEPQYETNSDDVRHQFEEHGEIKTFFDLISTRGMVFVTYVSPARQCLSYCVSIKLLTLVLSMTYVPQKEHEKDFRDQKSVVAL
jgi:hypothetical protein